MLVRIVDFASSDARTLKTLRIVHQEEVTYEGEIVQLDRVRLDVAYGDTSQETFRSTSAQPAQNA